MKRAMFTALLVGAALLSPRVRLALVDALTKTTGTWVGAPANRRVVE